MNHHLIYDINLWDYEMLSNTGHLKQMTHIIFLPLWTP